MKCPSCGAESRVLATRTGEHNTLTRHRECDNLHRFKTREVIAELMDLRESKKYLAAASSRAGLAKRNGKILRDIRPATEVAKDYGITEARVRQIRAELKNKYNAQ